MNDQDKQKLINLTQTQAMFLKNLFPNRTITANASGASQTHFSGKIVAGLREDGFVEPMGFKGKQRQWAITPEWEKKYNIFREEIITILDKIT